MNEYVETVQHMIDWIEKNLDQAKVLESLLREIGYSPWYCSVLFHDVIQKTLKFTTEEAIRPHIEYNQWIRKNRGKYPLFIDNSEQTEEQTATKVAEFIEGL